MHKVILVIRDGWGHRKEKANNAISQAKTPVTDKLMKEYPNVLIKASGEAVGLPAGYQGNSEVGHTTIGSGRIIYQPMERINAAIKDKSFFKNAAFLKAVTNAKKHNSTLHLIGLFQVEGVHSHLDHLLALLDLCKKEKFYSIRIHVLTDGRDAPVHDSLKHVLTIENKLKELGFGEIVTVSGRYYAMDRDKRWERTRLAYDCFVKGESKIEFADVLNTIKQSHAENVTDEFIIPRKKKGYKGVTENDSIIFFNFRTDRPRQLTQAIVEGQFEGWERKPLKVCYVGMTQFYRPMNALVAFEDISLKNLLGQVVADAGLNQFRISETEKYAHVTFFFNGQRENPFEDEDRLLIYSPKVATYDLKPEMSAYEVTEKLVERINGDKYAFIVVNLANTDMVGHTGNTAAIIKAIETVDECTGKIVEAGLNKNYALLVFADHGNAEDQTERWRTSHTINKVPLILVSGDKTLKQARLREGMGLSDIAPTVLDLMGLKKPKEMTGKSLIEK